MDYFRVGLIAKPHGVQGAVKLIPLSEDISRYKGLKQAYLERDGEYTPIEVSVTSAQPESVYARLSCCPDRDAAEKLRNLYVCVDRAHAVALPEGRYFVSDIIGCEALDTNGVSYGRIVDVLETGANDVYQIRGEKTLLIPALKKLLAEVDVPARRVVLHADVLQEVGLFED